MFFANKQHCFSERPIATQYPKKFLASSAESKLTQNLQCLFSLILSQQSPNVSPPTMHSKNSKMLLFTTEESHGKKFSETLVFFVISISINF